MRTLTFLATVTLCLLLTTTSRAEGLLYRLPEDGVWVQFQVLGNAIEPDGTDVTLTGTLTISSVGTIDVDGKRCRWIELANDAKVGGQPASYVEKLLIPEEHLMKGKEPLKHVVQAWQKHSMIENNKPRRIMDLEGSGAAHLKGIQPFLHGPYENIEKLEPLSIETKLGKLLCEGIKANEKTDQGGAAFDSTFTIRLHENAPFGVVAWEAKSKIEQNGKDLGSMTLKLKVKDFGKDAKSSIPEAK